MKTTLLTLVAAALMWPLTACGGVSVPDLDLADRLTQQAAGSPAPQTSPAPTDGPATPSPAAVPPTTAPAATPDAATLLQIRTLGTLVLTEQDLPPGFLVENSQAAFRDAIIAAQQGVPPLADYLSTSTLLGSWATLFVQGPQPVSQSSIVYLFADPADAAGFVAANAALETRDYAGATAIDPLPPPDVGDTSGLLRATTADGGSLELTWAQGPMSGQLILGYSGEEPANAVENIYRSCPGPGRTHGQLSPAVK